MEPEVTADIVPPRPRVPRDLGPPRVTVKDVARVAGVSHSTVSKALNASPEISEETRNRIAGIAADLGYRPNAIARGLKNRRTRTFGIITSDDDGHLGTALARGVAEVASAHEFGLFVCDSYGRADLERQHLTMLLDKQVDGIILAGAQVDHRGGPAAPTGDLPVAYLHGYTTGARSPCIVPDDQAGAHLATMHLIDLDRRRIAFINGPGSAESAALRLIGYRQAIDEAGLPVDYRIVRIAADWSQHSGYRATRDLMAQSRPPDAILCAGDGLAAGAILGLLEAGVGVPDEVPVIGFEDLPYAPHLPVPLTTVGLPLHKMGMLAADRLLGALDGEPLRDEIIRVPCRLVVRDSCPG
jgi:LacI family transcriptional regulator